MEIAAPFILPIGFLFLVSGLIVNLIQAICYVLLRPLSKNLYRMVNKEVVELLWLQPIWLFDWWAGIKVHLYADNKTFQSMGPTLIGYFVGLYLRCLNLELAWIYTYLQTSIAVYIIATMTSLEGIHTPGRPLRSGCLGSTLAVIKKSSVFLPVIGWSMWFSEYVFLERSWAKDESTLMSGFQRLKDFPRPLQLALFVEGTRFTQAKLLAAQEYAASTGLPIPKNVLIPRTKGFVSAVRNMRSFVPAIYDVTVAIPKDQPAPTVLRILKGQPSTIHIHMKRHLMKELPETDDGVAQWCRDIFVAKDALLDKHLAEGTFDRKEFKPIRRPIKSLLVVSFWLCLLIFGAYKFFKRSSFLRTWKGIASSTAAILLVTIVMRIFILFSQSERSTPAKVAPSRPKTVGSSSDANNDKQR